MVCLRIGSHDVTGILNLSGETGAMDLVLDPQFATNGYIYIVYSRNGATGPKSTDAVNTYRISRFTVSFSSPLVSVTPLCCFLLFISSGERARSSADLCSTRKKGCPAQPRWPPSWCCGPTTAAIPPPRMSSITRCVLVPLRREDTPL